MPSYGGLPVIIQNTSGAITLPVSTRVVAYQDHYNFPFSAYPAWSVGSSNSYNYPPAGESYTGTYAGVTWPGPGGYSVAGIPGTDPLADFTVTLSVPPVAAITAPTAPLLVYGGQTYTLFLMTLVVTFDTVDGGGVHYAYQYSAQYYVGVPPSSSSSSSSGSSSPGSSLGSSSGSSSPGGSSSSGPPPGSSSPYPGVGNTADDGGHYERVAQVTAYYGVSGSVQFNSSGTSLHSAGIAYWRCDTGPPRASGSGSSGSSASSGSSGSIVAALNRAAWDARAVFVTAAATDRNPQLVRDSQGRARLLFERYGGGTTPDVYFTYSDAEGLSWAVLTLKFGGAQFPVVRADDRGGVVMAALRGGQIVGQYQGPGDTAFSGLAAFADAATGGAIVPAAVDAFDLRPASDGAARWVLTLTAAGDAAPSLWDCFSEPSGGSSAPMTFRKRLVSGLTGGLRPVVATQGSRGLLLAAVGPAGGIRGQFMGPGDTALSAAQPFNDAVGGGAIPFAGGGFALAFSREHAGRLVLCLTVTGDAAPSEWACSSDASSSSGAGFAFRRLADS